jgi:glycosyltransferase involved in cell wall biosynthesis
MKRFFETSVDFLHKRFPKLFTAWTPLLARLWDGAWFSCWQTIVRRPHWDKNQNIRLSDAAIIQILTPQFFTPDGHEIYFGGMERYFMDLALLIQEMGYTPKIYQRGRGVWQRHYRGLTIQSIDSKGRHEFLGSHFYRQIPPNGLTIYGDFDLAWPACHPNSIGISHGIFWDNPANQPSLIGQQIYSALFLKAIAHLKKVVSVDTNTINWVRSLRAELVDRMLYIPNYVDIHEFKPKESSIQKNGNLTILFPRRLCEYRGFNLVAMNLETLLLKYSHLNFLFVGKNLGQGTRKDREGKETSYLSLLSQRYPNRIRHLAMEPDQMPQVYQEADISLIPTIYSEGTSLSCLEAMASGNAVIVTHVGGLTDLILDGHNGLLIRPTAEDLLQAIEKLIQNVELQNSLKHHALETSKNFRKELWQSRWREVIKRSVQTT